MTAPGDYQEQGNMPSAGQGARVAHLTHFGLRELPFSLTPDPAFLFPFESFLGAQNWLFSALAGGEGLIKLTGAVGAGKTLLCRTLRARDAEFRTVYIPNPAFDARTLYLAIAEGLGLAIDPGTDQHHLLKAIARGVLDVTRKGVRVVVCVDESQVMPRETLEAARLITNLETEKRKLVQVVLAGQPELDTRLASAELRPLLGRVTMDYRLLPLRPEEIGPYVAYRMTVAGFRGPPVLSDSAAQALYELSAGLPRMVNMLMRRSLELAAGTATAQVHQDHLRQAASEIPALEAATPEAAAGREPAAAAAAPAEAAAHRSEWKSEWFWRTVAALLAVGVGWVGWVAYNLQPVEGLITEQAFKAAEEARSRQASGLIQASPAAASRPGVEMPKERPFRLRMEETILTPIPDRPASDEASSPR